MKRLMLIMFCAMVSMLSVAQNNRIVKGYVMNENEEPLSNVTIKAVHSDISVVTGQNGRFEIEVSPYTKYVEASLEGYITERTEIDGSYVVFKLKVDKQLLKAKAKAEQEAKLAAEEAARAKAKAEQEAKLAAEEAEKARVKAEQEAKLAAEEAERARVKAEQEAKQEAKRVAEREAATKAKAEQKARLAAEREAMAKAKAEERARIKAQKEELATAKAQAAKERAENNRLVYSEHISGFNSMVDVTYSGGFSAANSNVCVNYIGGYRFNNYLFVGAGLGVRIPFDFKYNATLIPVPGELLPNKGLCVPLFLHARANFMNGRWSPFFAMSAGVRFLTPQTLQLDLLEIGYNNSAAAFVNPQIGVNFRTTANTGVYFSIGYSGYTNTKCVESTGYNAVLRQTMCGEFDIHLGVTF